MTARRRKWLIAAALAVLALAALLWAARAGGKMEVKLIFLGYTNKPVEEFGRVQLRPHALVMATNAGGTTVRIWPGPTTPTGWWTPDGETRIYIFPVMRSGGPSKILHARTGIIFETEPFMFSTIWSSGITGERWDIRDRLASRLTKWMGAAKASRVNRILDSPRYQPLTIGPITNLPPAVPSP